MIDPQHATVYRHILKTAQQLGDHRLELMVRRKLHPSRKPQEKERIIATPTGCVIIEFPAAAYAAAKEQAKPRRMWLTILGCLSIYPGSFIVLLYLTAFFT